MNWFDWTIYALNALAIGLGIAMPALGHPLDTVGTCALAINAAVVGAYTATFFND